MSFNNDILSEIVDAVTEDYKKTAIWLPFSALQIVSVFDKDDLSLLNNFIEDMRKSTQKNEQITIVKHQVEKYAKVIVKLLSLAKVIS